VTDTIRLPENFNWKYYLAVNKDLCYIDTKEEAVAHWHRHGYEENRKYCPEKPYSLSVERFFLPVDSTFFDNDTYKNIDKVYCINLKDRTDRWEHLSDIPNVERFDAIRTTDDIQKYTEYNLDYNPVDLEAAIYFHIHKGAYGAYLSHYLLWKKIVEEDIDCALILEDDICKDSLNHVLDSNILSANSYDLVQLSKRIKFDLYDNIVFDGAEAYLLSRQGAKILISLTQYPFFFDRLGVQKFNNLNYFNCETYSWSEQPAITCAVDKFMGYACQTDLLNFFPYPVIDINNSVASNSDIGLSEGINAWNFDQDTIVHYSKLLGERK